MTAYNRIFCSIMHYTVHTKGKVPIIWFPVNKQKIGITSQIRYFMSYESRQSIGFSQIWNLEYYVIFLFQLFKTSFNWELFSLLTNKNTQLIDKVHTTLINRCTIFCCVPKIPITIVLHSQRNQSLSTPLLKKRVYQFCNFLIKGLSK